MADFSMKGSISSHTSEEEDQAEEEELGVDGGRGRGRGRGETEEYDVSKPASPVSNPLLSPVTLPGSPATRSGRRSSSRGTVALLSPSQATSTARKPRGRPPGSKNKPKPPVYITKETEPAIKTQQLEIPAGCDVVEMVQKFARKHRVGVHVVNGTGSVSNFTLRHPAITLSGAFNLLSLSGTFMGASVCSSFSSCSKERAAQSSASPPWLAIFVGGSAGEVFGGTVVGRVVAASNVLLNVSTFANYEFHRVDPGEFEQEEEEDERPGGNRGRLTGKMEGCSVSTSGGGGVSMSAVGFAVPAEHLSWAPPSGGIRPPNHHF